MVVYSFAAHVLLPWRVVSALAASGTLVATQVALWRGRPPVASLLMLASANLLGLLAFLWVERMQRRAFLETRQSLEAKLVVEEESQVSATRSKFHINAIALGSSYRRNSAVVVGPVG
ncbi:hypothetical protein HPB51_011458 [Rhipicephalus microplus]|uniref:Uncharacterized protein n=1 Tax=Rhipicephalus microplus TaxID=6941 RepID=A0A9J6DUP2_RHIMP|nr:hypothetical protein HPB51_011458 [Rhipicephalus microplus]